MAGVLIHEVSGYSGSAYNLKIPSLTDPANIQEAMMLFHYGIDSYDGSIEPADASVFGNLRDFDNRIAQLEETEVVQLEGTVNQIVSSGSVGFVTLSLPNELIAPGSLEVTTSGLFGSNLSTQGSLEVTTFGSFGSDLSTEGTLLVSSSATFESDVVVLGDLVVSGSTTFINTQNLQILDPLIYLSNEQYSTDVLDSGFTSAYGTGGMDVDNHLHRGFAYDITDSKWKLFSNVPHPLDNSIDYTSANYDILKLGTVESSTVTNTDTITTNNLVVTGDFDHRINLTSQSANYIIGLGDVGEIIQMNVGSANTLTIPADGTTNFPIGSQLVILQIGAGQTTITPGGGVTVNGTPGLKLRAQWSSATLVKRAANTWVALGDLVA